MTVRTAVRVPYRSTRALAGYSALGEVATGQTGGGYLDYAQAIYQALNGDVVGGAYSAALTFAGPLAAIGNAVADYLNRSRDMKSDATSKMLEALHQADILKLVEPRTQTYLVVGRCTVIKAKGEARAVSEAMRKGESPEVVKGLFREWLATEKPFTPGGIYAPMRKWCEPPYTTSPPVPAPIVPLPVVTIAPPAPVAIASPSPTGVAAPSLPVVAIAPVSIQTPAPIVPNVPAAIPAVALAPQSVPPDQTPALIATLIANGASQEQAFQAAMASLVSRRVPPTPQVQQKVAQDVSRASAPQMASTVWIVLAAATLFGVSLIFGSASR
jgi:hypothetical protein